VRGSRSRCCGCCCSPLAERAISEPPTENYNPSLGDDVASGGDVNGDGIDDLVVTAVGTVSGDEDGGRAYLYLGGEFE